MRVVLTAGHDRALHVVALAELLGRRGHVVAAVLVVSPFRIRRVRALVRQRGVGFLRQAARRLTGRRAGSGSDPLAEFLTGEGIAERSLRRWARAHGAAYHVVPELNGPAALQALRAAAADGVLYGGGGILRPAFLQAAGGRVLNAHSGPLPHVRGMNACEWALLLAHPPAVTIHVIDAGIDTGGVVEVLPLAVHPGEGIDVLRARCSVLGVQGLLRAVPALAGPLPPAAAEPAPGRQCFVLAPVLRELLEARLRVEGGT